MVVIGSLLLKLIQLFTLALVVRVIFSWIPDPPSPLDKVGEIATFLTEWACGPLRRMIPPLPLGGIALDVSILVVFFLAQLASQLVVTVFY